MKKISVGIVGCGWIANNAYLPAMKEVEVFQITAVYDPIVENARNIAARYNITEIYDNYEEFLESEVEAIIICSPNYTHKELAVRALSNDKHVLCEKPVAMNKHEMKEINDAAKRSKGNFIPAFVNRFRKDIKHYIEYIQSGLIGEVLDIEASWVRESGIPRPGTWFTNKEKAGGGVLIDLGSHIVDICMMITNGNRIVEHLGHNFTYGCKKSQHHKAVWFESQEEQSEMINVESRVEANVRLDNQKGVKLFLAWESEEDGDYTQFIVHGTKGILQLDTLFGFSKNNKWDKIRILSSIQGKEQEVKVLEQPDHMALDAFQSLLSYYGESIINQQNTYLSIIDGNKTTDFIDALYIREVDYGILSRN